MPNKINSDPEQSQFWHKRVGLLALPIIFSNISVPLVGAVDTAVMGHLQEVELIGAVALGASIFSLVFWIFGFLRMGTSGLVAQAHGALDHHSITLTLWRSLLIAVALGLCVITLQKPLFLLFFGLLDASERLVDLTEQYYSTRIWAAPATLANYVVLGTLIGLQRMSSVLIFQLFLNLLNISLDILFVPVLGWDIKGVALASVISEYAALVLGLFLIRRPLYEASHQLSRLLLFNRAALIELFSLNGNIFIRTLLLVLSFIYFTASSTKLGVTALAANAILIQILHLCAHALDGFAHAVETLSGQAWGSKNRKHLTLAIKVSTQQSMLVAVLMSVAIYFGGPQLISLFTNQIEVIEFGLKSLPWLIILPVISVWCYQLDGIFIGTTHSREMRNAMIASAGFFVICTEILTRTMGNAGLWTAFCAFMLIRALTLLQYLPGIIRKAGTVPTQNCAGKTHD